MKNKSMFFVSTQPSNFINNLSTVVDFCRLVSRLYRNIYLILILKIFIDRKNRAGQCRTVDV